MPPYAPPKAKPKAIPKAKPNPNTERKTPENSATTASHPPFERPSYAPCLRPLQGLAPPPISAAVQSPTASIEADSRPSLPRPIARCAQVPLPTVRIGP